MTDNNAFEVQSDVRQPWRQYLDLLEPLRPDLHRYCMSLTGNVWDGEDLLQDAIIRVFSLLGKHDDTLENPRAYLIRTATNLWIDRIRRFAKEQTILSQMIVENNEPAPDMRIRDGDAASRLFQDLSPKERAALLMKDVLDMSAEESASILQTSVSAVKSSLNRGRDRLAKRRPALAFNAPSREIVEAFLKALRETDIDTLRALCSEDMSGDLVGGTEMATFDRVKPVFEHAHFVFPDLGFGENPWWELIEYEGEYMVVGYRTLNGIEGLNEIHRLEVENNQIMRLRVYCFCPDTLRVIAKKLGRVIVERPMSPYRSPSNP